MSPTRSRATVRQAQDGEKVVELAKDVSTKQVLYQILMMPCPTCQQLFVSCKLVSLLVFPLVFTNKPCNFFDVNQLTSKPNGHIW